MKIRKKFLVGIITASMLVFGALSVSAYTGNYSFEISAAVYGTNVHTLTNVSTSTNVSANTYYYDYSVSPTKEYYTVQLYKSWLTNYSTSQIKADGNSYIKSYGVIASGDYTINVFKNTGDTGYIIGNGTINQ